MTATRFTILPPPGIDTRWEFRLTREPYPICHVPRYLFCGYRYEIPFTGVFCGLPFTQDSGRKNYADPQFIMEPGGPPPSTAYRFLCSYTMTTGVPLKIFNAVGTYYCFHNEYDPRTGTWFAADPGMETWFRLHDCWLPNEL